MKIAATIQARLGSARLPGKVLLPVVGKPLLAHQIERIKRSQLVDEVIVATTTKAEDDAIVRLAEEAGARSFRGSETRVLDRVADALRHFDVGINVECYGDSPLPDSTVIDGVIGSYLKYRDEVDYVSNGVTTTFPPGVEVAVYPAAILHEVRSIAREEEREYLSPNILARRDRYRIRNVEAPPWYHWPDLHLEVDTAEDFALVKRIYEALYPVNPRFLLSDILEFVRENPRIAELNRDVPRRWKTLREDVTQAPPRTP